MVQLLILKKVSKIAKKHHIPLIVDNTLATPYLHNPIDWGANIITHSLLNLYVVMVLVWVV